MRTVPEYRRGETLPECDAAVARGSPRIVLKSLFDDCFWNGEKELVCPRRDIHVVRKSTGVALVGAVDENEGR
jgi:hypothetical protein